MGDLRTPVLEIRVPELHVTSSDLVLGDARISETIRNYETKLRLKHPPRPCRSQRDHPVTGRSGSVQPMGHPIVQSEKAGLT